MFSNKSLIRRLVFMLVLSIGLFFLGTLITRLVENYNSPQNVVKRLNSDIIHAEIELAAELSKVEKLDLHNKSKLWEYYVTNFQNTFNTSNIEFLVYKNDVLFFWSHNSFPAPIMKDSENFMSEVIKTGNGFYLAKQVKKNDHVIVVLKRIKSEFKYNNEYLPASFAKGFRASAQVNIELKQNGNDIKNKEGKYLFSVSYKSDYELSDWLLYLVFVLYLSSMLCLISATFFAYMYFMRDFGSRSFLLLTFIANVFLIRFIQYFYGFPGYLYQTKLFSPEFFASSVLLPSLGDFLINAALLLQVTVLIFKYHKTSKLLKFAPNWIRNTLVFVFTGSTFLLFLIATITIQGLILNSSIVYRFENILSLGPISHLAIVIVVLVLLTFLFYSILIYYQAFKLIGNRLIIFVSIFWLVVSGTFIYLNFESKFTILCFIALYYAVLVYQLPKLRFNYIKIGSIVLLLLVLTSFATLIINSSDKQREKNQRVLIAAHLADARDNLAEYLFSEAQNLIVKDKEIAKSLQNSQNDLYLNDIANDLRVKYFLGYWDRYEIQITICKPNKKLNIQPGNVLTDCDQYFEALLSNQMRPVNKEGLYFLRQAADAMYYIGKIPIDTETGTHIGNIYIEISSNELWKGIGYPELLIDEKLARLDNLSGYSYAFYYKNELIKNVGKCSYNIDNKQYKSVKAPGFISIDGYTHLVYSPDKDTQIILSRAELKFTDLISPFSYILLLFISILFLIRLNSGPAMDLRTNMYTFRIRLQFIMVSVILVSSMIIVGSSLLFINQLNSNKNNEILNEKLNSVLVELETEFSNIKNIEEIGKENVQEMLINLSNTYFTDINIYKTNGYMHASSREKVFSDEMMSRQINPSAYKQLAVDKRTFFIQTEKIGNYNFLSAYAPIRNIDNQIIGFLNLPHFARQVEIGHEISGLITTFANIYIIMIVVSILLALLFSKLITKPLQHIGDQFSKVRLANSNPKIEWHRKDEIGRLVDEYNRMIDEMAKSAELLARSERESAWRQMARQVAHEIKNPLTPIKLSMQLLLRAWQDQTPDWESRLKRFSQTLIMQIDTLSSIATEFSDFAQMPEPEIQTFDVIPLIQQSTALYRDQSDCEITFDTSLAESIIKADPNQMLRVFNNLIKNALQAIPSEKLGIIHIELYHDSDQCIISFQDNGTGIPTEKQTRIFSPNFTTKTTGMGLGLAMVKNIIDSSSGRIWFETNPGEGTTFYVSLPLSI